jgi:peptidoglycan/LPS O-acetylase OafA/YrhL
MQRTLRYAEDAEKIRNNMNRKTIAGERRRRKLMTALWALGIAAVVITLIYLEQSAILYILCTISIAVLLLIVAFSDLAHEQKGQDLAQATDLPGAANRER